jgi:hypothetical protein
MADCVAVIAMGRRNRMSEHPDVPGLQPDPESAEAVGDVGPIKGGPGGSEHDMGGNIGPADMSEDDPERVPDRPELDT